MPPLKAQLLLAESLAAYFPEMVFTDSGITVQLHRNTHQPTQQFFHHDQPMCALSSSRFGSPMVKQHCTQVIMTVFAETLLSLHRHKKST